jgi:hypothetical protein
MSALGLFCMGWRFALEDGGISALASLTLFDTMKLFFKGRLGWVILINWLTILSNFAQTDSLAASHRIKQDTSVLKKMETQVSDVVGDLLHMHRDTASVSFSFETKEQALDTLIAWLLMKRPSMGNGYLPKQVFIDQWRSHDTTTFKQVVEGNWLSYQYRFKKSLLKTQLGMKRSKVNFKMAEVVPRPKITISAAGDGITKYDYTVKYKKLKYILSFQLWWIEGKAYWVNEVTWGIGV